MSILEALQEVNASLSRSVTLIYADLNEANFDVDKLTNTELPVVVILPIVPVDNRGKSGVLKTTFELQAFFLNKSEKITTDYKSIEIETEVIAPMRRLAREFIFKLTEHSIIDPETAGIAQATHQPIYSSMDANLFGVYVRCDVPVMEGITGCVH
jgi:hypothetical protein